ncbi:sterol desaturase family protein [Pseudemcibacter aquimaris]|uniref:sterol desaturase family protein n=1 Tax=Pseudemcibacter aquimaris TaxID=2857064 RepID=UPI002013616E|nr:sterol desaturase family protein [Pseudemcibacter aquimaris]MCC3861847.1 sterol desaturase family protein [Pseudemcibacter aquimaris]WDU58600.1 sterol desaturase family protein [Pseudemcibacter aquimaris]
MESLVENEQNVRLGIFLFLLIFFGVLEFMIPLAKRQEKRLSQWFTNISITIIDTIAMRVVLPIIAVGVAKYAAENDIGLFNIVDIGYWPAFIMSLLLLDVLIYGQHVMMHKVPMFWRLHRMHHSELGLDVTTAVRFHPIEIIISMLIKMAFVYIMGIPVAALIVFEILLNGLALFNHSNIKLASGLENLLRKIFVTPEIHWIYHSEKPNETNSNYGFNLVIWDKMFGTYTDKPTLDYPTLRQGLPEFGFEKPVGLLELMVSPFKAYKVKDE